MASPAGALSVDAICSELGLRPSSVQLQAFDRFSELLQRWNRVYNLTALRDNNVVLSHHLADCLAAMPALSRQLAEVQSPRLLDVGSGGGLPGVVVAILFPGIKVVCVDAVAKKTAFIQQVSASLQLSNLKAVHGRVEKLAMGNFSVITARAFSSLSDLYRLTAAHSVDHTVWLAMKGRIPEAEMAELPGAVEVFHVEPLRVPGLAAQRCLIWMRQFDGAEPDPACVA